MNQPVVTEPWQQAAGSRILRPAACFFRGLRPAGIGAQVFPGFMHQLKDRGMAERRVAVAPCRVQATFAQGQSLRHYGDEGANARDRIGKGPWHNAKGVLVAKSVEDLHSDAVNLTSRPP
jgi:hypothetical protein